LTRLPAFAVTLVLLIVSALSEEVQRETLEGPGVSVMFPPGRESFARSALSMYAEGLDELEHRLGLSPQRTASIVLTRTATEFREITGGRTHPWIAALAYASEDLIVIDGSKIEMIGMNDLMTTLTHELTHILLAQAVEGRDALPLWFNEGVAVWASAPLFPTPREETILAAKSGRLLHYSELNDSFPSSHREVELAYAESHEFISHLETRFGQGTIKAVIGQMKNGASVDDALLQVTHEPLDQLWDEWAAELVGRSGVMAVFKLISRHGLPLFGVLAGLVFLGYLRYLLVKRRKMRRWEEEERMGYW